MNIIFKLSRPLSIRRDNIHIYKCARNFLVLRRLKTDCTASDLAYSCYNEKVTSGPPLVILHGLLDSRNNWNSLSKAIHNTTGRMVISIDARNHGESKHTPEHSYIHMAHDVMNLLKELEISKVSLLGHSMGSRTSQAISLLNPDLVSSIIAVDMSPVRISPKILFMSDIFEVMSTVSIESGIEMSEAKKLAHEQLKCIAPSVNLRNFLLENLMVTDTGSYTWRANIQFLKQTFVPHMTIFPPSLRGLKYTGPILFIAGSLSDFISINDLPEIREYFPQAELIFIEGVGHWVHRQKPEEFLEIVCKFFGEEH